jgi:hypothetical protein
VHGVPCNKTAEAEAAVSVNKEKWLAHGVPLRGFLCIFGFFWGFSFLFYFFEHGAIKLCLFAVMGVYIVMLCGAMGQCLTHKLHQAYMVSMS